MQIKSIATVAVSVPLRTDRMITSSRGTHDRSPFLLIRISADGEDGYGEVSSTPRWSGEDATTAQHVIERYIAPIVVGMDAKSPSTISEAIRHCVAGHHFTKAGVEMAVWDLVGKVQGVPVHRLLGGPVRDTVRTKFSMSGESPEQVARLTTWAIKEGFTAIKIKVARDGLRHDLDNIAEARRVAGPDVLIGVDANGGWNRTEARQAISALTEASAGFVEQPLARDDLEGMASLREGMEVPLVADESVGTTAEAARVIREGAADVLAIYVGMAGGIGPAMQIAEMANDAGLGWTIGSNLELGVAMSAQIQVALVGRGLADTVVPCDIISNFYYEESILTQPLPVEAGHVSPSTGPGLGVTLDEEILARYRIPSDRPNVRGGTSRRELWTEAPDA